MILPSGSPQSNGAPESVLQATIRGAAEKDWPALLPEVWRKRLLYCHIPPDAPAYEWRIGIERVLMCGQPGGPFMHLDGQETFQV